MSALPRFRDASLLELALTHASAGDRANNERLEFLGDAVLDLVVAEELYRRRQDLSEGALTELKATVVSRASLAVVGRELQLGREARLGPGLRRETLPVSVMANLVEALVGALYLDSGLEAAAAFCRRVMASSLAEARASDRAQSPKQELQELAQARFGTTPEYRVVCERGRAHARAFLVEAVVDGVAYPRAWGRTRKEAERWAAYEALLRIDRAEGRAASR